jgi:hypothetical protein
MKAMTKQPWQRAAEKELEKAKRRIADENAEQERLDALDVVELIASGYEWTCLDEKCDTLNHEIEITDTVICDGCGKEYRVDEAYHAHG